MKSLDSHVQILLKKTPPNKSKLLILIFLTSVILWHWAETSYWLSTFLPLSKMLQLPKWTSWKDNAFPIIHLSKLFLLYNTIDLVEHMYWSIKEDDDESFSYSWWSGGVLELLIASILASLALPGTYSCCINAIHMLYVNVDWNKSGVCENASCEVVKLWLQNDFTAVVHWFVSSVRNALDLDGGDVYAMGGWVHHCKDWEEGTVYQFVIYICAHC